jgi:hypothetical protein
VNSRLCENDCVGMASAPDPRARPSQPRNCLPLSRERKRRSTPKSLYLAKAGPRRISHRKTQIRTLPTPLLAGLSPAGMAASFAARSFSTEAVDSAARPTSVSPQKLTPTPQSRPSRSLPWINSAANQLGIHSPVSSHARASAFCGKSKTLICAPMKCVRQKADRRPAAAFRFL